MSLNPRRWLEITHGRDALLHTLGEGECFHVGQLPFPGVCGQGDEPAANPPRSPWVFGAALAVSFMKLTRPEAGYRIDIDHTTDLCCYVEAMPNDETRHGFLCGIETLLSIALIYPERLPIIIERLDAMDNAALTEQATRALLYEPEGLDGNGDEFYYGDDGGIFAGLTDAVGVRP